MTGLTLAQIQKSIKRIEGKIDIILETPLKQAKDRFLAALNMISHKKQKIAYETLKDVIDHASQAFHYKVSKDMTIADLEACIQATQLLIFSYIARFSYDEGSETFLPFLTLSMEDKSMIATELIKIVNRCIDNRKRVRKDSLFSSSSEHKAKVQDTLDTILQVTYPFISEGKGWTKSTTKFDLQDNTVNISVMPKYVPMGEEDMTTLILGVYTQKKKYLKVNIWRTKDMIYISGYGNYSRKITSETEIEKFSIDKLYIVLSSKGGAAKHQGGHLGQYCFDPDSGFYVQTNIEKGIYPSTSLAVSSLVQSFAFSLNQSGLSIPHNSQSQVVRKSALRLCSNLDDGWYVNDGGMNPKFPKNPPENKSMSKWYVNDGGMNPKCLRNPTKDKSLPLEGWEYYDSDDKTWHSDTRLVISPGPLSSLCDSLTVSASGPAAKKWPECLGEFNRDVKMWWNGKPVFRNKTKQLLHQSDERGWGVGHILGTFRLRGSMAHHCPASEQEWSYWDGTKHQLASVKISCKVHA